MRHIKYLIIILFLSLFHHIFNLQCGEEYIEHCEICSNNAGEIGTCAKCEDNYFPFLSNYLCLPCEHKIYGAPGCKGNCKIDNDKHFKCDEFGCKEGFYSLDKFFCMNCNSESSPFCAKCSYLPPSGKNALSTNERNSIAMNV